MKKIITTIFLILTLFLVVTYRDHIMQFIMINIIYHDDDLNKPANEYMRDENWNFVQMTDDFYPKNKKDIINIVYTTLNKGWDEIIFYCPIEYKKCMDDVNEIAINSDTLSYVNSYVGTYNSYNKIYVNLNTLGRINIQVNKIYNDELINEINTKVQEIYDSLITDDMSDRDKIKAIHDYIINNTRYDEQRADEIRNDNYLDDIHSSNTAYGPLFTGLAICGGYTDAMALFLDKMGIRNFKVASERHIWNAVYIDGEWKHLDLTWDDPVVVGGGDVLSYNYFLISTEELKSKNDAQHKFNEEIFSEVK